MDHLRPLRPHDERRLLDRIVPDGDNQVGAVHRLVDIVALGQRRSAHVELGATGDGALAHLGREKRDAGSAHEAAEACGAARTRCGGAEHDQRPLRLEDHGGRAVQRLAMGDGHLDGMGRHHGDRVDLFASDILR